MKVLKYLVYGRKQRLHLFCLDRVMGAFVVRVRGKYKLLF